MSEQPEYSKISELEMRELEAEFGHPLTHELALWMIRNRLNRAAIQRMTNQVQDEEQPPSNPARRAARRAA